MGLMTQKDLAKKGAGQINAFLAKSKEDAIQKQFDEDAMEMAEEQAEYESNLWKTDPALAMQKGIQEPGLISPIDSVLEFTGVSSLGDAFASASSALEGDYLGAGIEGLAAMVGAVPIVGSKLKKPLKDALGSNKVTGMRSLKKIDADTKEEWQKLNKVKQRQEQLPELKQSAQDKVEGKIDTAQHQANVDAALPVKLITEVPPVPTHKEMGFALTDNKVEAGLVGKTRSIKKGERVSTRLDIPAYDNYDTWVVSVHFPDKGTKNAYAKTASLKDVTFAAPPRGGYKISQGTGKAPIAMMGGKWQDIDPKKVQEQAKSALNSDEWTQVGYNPFRHSYFYDKVAKKPVVSATELIQVGPLVLARGVKYADPDDARFLVGDTGKTFNKGGLVDAEMATLNFSHGGSVHGKVGASNVGADMLAKLIAQNKKGDFKRRDAREDAREVMQAPQSTPTPVDNKTDLDAAVIKMVEDHKRTQVERAEEFSKPQGLTDKLSNLAEEGGNVLSSMGGSLVAMGGEGYEKAADMGESFMDAGGEIYGEFKDTAKLIRNKVKNAYQDYNNGSIVESQMTAALTPTEPTITSRSTYDDETSDVMPEGSLLYPRILESNKALYGNLWGKTYHTELEDNAAGQKLYTENVKAHVKPYSRYVKIIAPILNKVIPAFAGDSNVKGDRLYRAMLEIGAAESNGADRAYLYNTKTGASGPFQTLASSVKDSVNRVGYYGPMAEKLTGKSKKEIQDMSKSEIETWMQTDFTSNAVFGTIELIKLAKGQADKGNPQYLKQLTGFVDKTEPMNASSNTKDKTNWKKMIP